MRWCIACLVWAMSLSASLDNFLKNANQKSDFYLNQLVNVDFIYVINLDQRPEKFVSCVEQLAPYGISPYRFSAVNGWELSLDDLNQIGVKFDNSMPKNLWGTCYLPDGNFEPHHEVMSVEGRNYFCHCMPRGSIGIVLSHLSVLRDAYDSGYETIWVMEDDIEVIRNPREISTAIAALDRDVGNKKWDILFTDRDTKGQQGQYVSCTSFARRPDFSPKNPKKCEINVKINKNFRRIGTRYGAYSMIVRRSGMKKILDFYSKHNLFLPYDMEYAFPDSIAMYTVLNDIVSTQPKALSDNGGQNYLNKQASSR